MPRNVEATVNTKLGELLCLRNPHWVLNRTLFTECSDMILGSAGSRIDILVHPDGGQPVAIETEFREGPQVEREARSRLGKVVKPKHEVIECSMAVAMPSELRQSVEYLDRAEFTFSTHQLDEQNAPIRWPTHDWITGKIDRLADAIEYISLSERRLQIGANILEEAIEGIAEVIRREADQSTLELIADCLHQKNSKQTVRMAVAILLNAVVFHYSIDEDEVPRVVEIRDQEFSLSSIERAWNQILNINYWPIFSIAKNILREIPVRLVGRVFEKLNESAERLVRLGSGTFHDLSGRMFQRLIVDRKFLATFYTLPASAQLLAELATDRLDVDWSDHEAICNLRIADFACGTGALLSAVQRDLYRRFRRAGKDDRTIHRHLLEQVLIGLDIMPASTHITASMLSSPYPRTTYGSSMIHTLPYGQHSEDFTPIGSLDLLDRDYTPTLFDTRPKVNRLDGTVVNQEKKGVDDLRLPDGSCDIVIMNPPFTRPTNHEIANVPVPSFAGFGTTGEEQKAMSEKLRKIIPKIRRTRGGKFGDGRAGLASNFMDLAHSKLKPKGILAMVLPFSFVAGAGWANARRMLRKCYDNIRIISIATSGSHDRAFSADTGMAECLLVATKVKVDVMSEGTTGGAQFSTLLSRPSTFLEASEYRDSIWKENAYKDSILEAGGVGVRDQSILNTIQQLCEGVLAFPRADETTPLPIISLGEVAGRGVVHREIVNKRQGAFIKRSPYAGEVPTYPMLWSHDCDEERSLIVSYDACGEIRSGFEDQAHRIWRKASRLHSTLDFRINSQSLAMCLTPEPCIGGRAWPNVIPNDVDHEIPLLLWSNSTLGLMMFWYKGTRPHQGRAGLTISRLSGLPVLDVRTLTEAQLKQCYEIFQAFKDRQFLPANEAYRDLVRKELDTELFRMLGIKKSFSDGLELLRRKWCAEPSVHGGKSTRITLDS
ncbi:MAG: hypothetical protein OXI44_01445 [Bacteroidota bacterium]|nr:hypothetical protein [Bacteroidota bacterium]